MQILKDTDFILNIIVKPLLRPVAENLKRDILLPKEINGVAFTITRIIKTVIN
jgi:hypothetical protein